jgi:hypothetical protein
MTQEQRFEQAEELSKKTFKDFCEQQNYARIKRFTPGKYDDYDVYYKHKSDHVIGEIKKRDYDSDRFDFWYLEIDKYNRLMDIAKGSKMNVKVHYINHFNNNITAIWDLNTIDVSKLQVSIQKLPKNNFTDEVISKPVYHLHLIDAQSFETDLEKSMFKITNKNKNQEDEDEDENYGLPF